MAAIVSDIISGSRTVIANALGAGWQTLRHWYTSPELNDIRSAKQAYNVRPLGAISVDGVNRYYTVDQTFEVILTDTMARIGSDTELETALLTLYNKADEIFKAMHNSKVNGTAGVLLVAEPSLSEPEFFNDNKLILLRLQYVVKYRGATTT